MKYLMKESKFVEIINAVEKVAQKGWYNKLQMLIMMSCEFGSWFESPMIQSTINKIIDNISVSINEHKCIKIKGLEYVVLLNNPAVTWFDLSGNKHVFSLDDIYIDCAEDCVMQTVNEYYMDPDNRNRFMIGHYHAHSFYMDEVRNEISKEHLKLDAGAMTVLEIKFSAFQKYRAVKVKVEFATINGVVIKDFEVIKHKEAL